MAAPEAGHVEVGVVSHEHSAVSALIDNREGLSTCDSSEVVGVYAAAFTLFNILNGVATLSAAYAVQRAGYGSLVMLAAIGLMCAYSAELLTNCMEGRGKGVRTYQEIAGVGFGPYGRLLATWLVYSERIISLVSSTILIGSSLSALFPLASSLPIPHARLDANQLLTSLCVLAVLPFLWARDVRVISAFSLAGTISTIVVVIAVVIDGSSRFPMPTHMHSHSHSHSYTISAPPLLNISNLAFVSGIYSFCFAGNVLVPTVYSTVREPYHFKKVILFSFMVTGAIFSSFGVFGAMAYGRGVESPVILSLDPGKAWISKTALWTTLTSSLSKIPLGISPVADDIEVLLLFSLPRLINSSQQGARMIRSSLLQFAIRAAVRSTLLLTVLISALCLPFFSEVMSVSGSSLEISLSIILPCLFYIKIYWNSSKLPRLLVPCLFMAIGTLIAVVGTISSTQRLIATRNQTQ